MICSVLLKYDTLYSGLLQVYSLPFIVFVFFSLILFCAALFHSTLLIKFIIIVYYVNFIHSIYFIFSNLYVSSAPHFSVTFYLRTVNKIIFNLLFYAHFSIILDHAIFQVAVRRPLPVRFFSISGQSVWDTWRPDWYWDRRVS